METPITARALVLWSLLQGPTFGADIVARIRDRSGGEILLSDGSLYPALDILLGRKMVVERRCKENARRRVFELTDAGRTEAYAVMRMLRALAEPSESDRKPKTAGLPAAPLPPARPASPAPARGGKPKAGFVVHDSGAASVDATTRRSIQRQVKAAGPPAPISPPASPPLAAAPPQALVPERVVVLDQDERGDVD